MFKYYAGPILILVLTTFMAIAGCGEKQSPPRGSATFNLQWEKPGSFVGKSVGVVTPDICIDYGIQTITASFIDNNGVTKATGNFACSDHQGKVTGIPAANNYTVRMDGILTSGSVVGWRGEKGGVSIAPIDGNSIGTVTMSYIGSDTSIPTVTSSNPANGDSAASTTSALSVSFSEAMAPSTINNSTFTLLKGSLSVAGTVTYDAATKMATFTPSAPLANSTAYELNVSTGVKDMADNGLSTPVICNFTTAGPTATYTISGTINDGNLGLSGVTVTRTGSGLTVATTGNSGSYSLSEVEKGSYTLTPSLANYIFNPASQIIDVSGPNQTLTVPAFTATKVIVVPIAPTGLTATAISSSQINLTWTHNLLNVTGFRIERTTAAGTTIYDVAANSTSYNDTGLTSSTAYSYRVLAINRGVNSSYSDVAADTTKALLTDPTIIDIKTGMQLVKVTGSNYTMGDAFGDGATNERPTHSVTLGDFYIGKYEVTQEEWSKVMPTNPSAVVCTNCPVESVSWDDVKVFIATLNQQSGKAYRLPTEAEWEYAARSGGGTEKYSGGNDVDAVAWYSVVSIHSVGGKTSNNLGLFDMSGNVWEWVNDIYSSSYYVSSPQLNPTGPALIPDTAPARVFRGGGWNSTVNYVTTTFRGFGLPTNKYTYVGFRLAASP